MKLDTFSYIEHPDNEKYWKLEEFKLNDINLIVGSNSSGKSRTLNVISGLSKLLISPKIVFRNGDYKACFTDIEKNKIKYNVLIKNGIIENEELFINEEQLIKRNKKGEGFIKSIAINTELKFKIPFNELVAFRKDEIQYPYLNKLYDWASKLRHFRFAKEQEKNTLAIIDSNKPKPEEHDLKETDKAIYFFKRGKKEYGDKFVQKIIEDFNKIGYAIEKIELGPLKSIQIEAPIASNVVGLLVKENDRVGVTDQHSMSDGMFRALSILIHFNYYYFVGLSGNVLIDDIGEGLDFDRSTKLIKLLIQKSIETNIQLVMSTNDKFVMNNTKLEFWQIINRIGSDVKMYNINNSEKEFKQFRFTGLNNFEFFSTGFFKKGLK